jgi:hypothetical protein
MTNFDLEEQLRPALVTNERLLWTGKPKTGIVFRRTDAFLIPFSLLWGGFAFFWEAMAIATSTPLFFKLWGIPFVLVGLYIMIGRFFVDAKQRAKTIYGITPYRIIIKSGLFTQNIQSFNIKNITGLTLSEKPDGSGTITFGTGDAVANNQAGKLRSYKLSPRLELIDDVKTVYNKLIELQRNNK